jgi:thymidylate synthase
MRNYQYLVKDIMHFGFDRSDRTGVGTRALVGQQLKFDLRKGFPLQTTKKVHWKAVVHELLWFLRGETNVKSLQAEGVTIWDEWADKDGNLGAVYGSQWRNWVGADGTRHDQIKDLITSLRNDPFSRRHVVSAWNVSDLNYMALAPCHCLFQMIVDDKFGLHCVVTQRSADVFLGVPFNIASYALLTCMVAQVTGLMPASLTMNFGDVHLYKNHFEQATEMLTREPRPLPTLVLDQNIQDLFAFKFEDIDLIEYKPHPAIKAPVAV